MSQPQKLSKEFVDNMRINYTPQTFPLLTQQYQNQYYQQQNDNQNPIYQPYQQQISYPQNFNQFGDQVFQPQNKLSDQQLLPAQLAQMQLAQMQQQNYLRFPQQNLQQFIQVRPQEQIIYQMQKIDGDENEYQVDEFDYEFFVNNPSIIISQNMQKQNQESKKESKDFAYNNRKQLVLEKIANVMVELDNTIEKVTSTSKKVQTQMLLLNNTSEDKPVDLSFFKQKVIEELKVEIRKEIEADIIKKKQQVNKLNNNQKSEPSQSLSSNNEDAEQRKQQIIDDDIDQNHKKNESSLSKYTFGKVIQNPQEDQAKKNQIQISKLQESENSSQNQFSNNSYEPDSSDESEQQLRESYEKYGMMIKKGKKKLKLDHKLRQLKQIVEEVPSSSGKDQDEKSSSGSNKSQLKQKDGYQSSPEIKNKKPKLNFSEQINFQNMKDLDNNSSHDKMNSGRLKQFRSNSLSQKGLQYQKPYQNSNLTDKNNPTTAGAERRISIQTPGFSNKKGSQRSLFSKNQEDQVDHFLIEIENQRQEIFEDIQALFHRKDLKEEIKNNQEDQIQLSKSNKMIYDKLKEFKIIFNSNDLQRITSIKKTYLKGLINDYTSVLLQRSNYKNVENIENESKSEEEENASYQDEESEQESFNKEPQQKQNTKIKQEYNNSSNKISQSKERQKKKSNNSETQNKGKFYNEIQPERKRQNYFHESSLSQKQNQNAEYQSYDDQEEEENEESCEEEIVSDYFQDKNFQQEKEFSKNDGLQQTPSLGQIFRNPSYQSLSSQHIRKVALKYKPKDKKFTRKNSQTSIRSKASQQKPLQEMMSESSGKYKQNLFSNRLVGLELDYHQYLKSYQGMFIVQCQAMNSELAIIRQKYDLEKMMVEFKKFKKLQKEIQQDEVYRGLQTIIIDIENTLVTQIEIKNRNELDQIRQSENFKYDYIVISKSVMKRDKKEGKKESLDEEICCDNRDNCICDYIVFQVRPYTYEILRAIQPFFEILVFTKMHHKILENIIDHIEAVLNKPIKEFLEKFKSKSQKNQFQRMKKLPDIKIYFQFIIHQRQYIHLKEFDKWIENLLVLTKNRLKENLIFISSNPFRIITAMKGGFLTIPIIQFESFYRDDFQLALIEHYILKIRHLKDMKKRLKEDFKFLLQKIQKPPKIKQNNNMEDQQKQSDNMSVRSRAQEGDKDNALCFDTASMGSFGFKKIKENSIMNQKLKQNQQQESKNETGSQKKYYSAFRPKNNTKSSSLSGSFKNNNSGVNKSNSFNGDENDDDEDYDEEQPKILTDTSKSTSRPSRGSWEKKNLATNKNQKQPIKFTQVMEEEEKKNDGFTSFFKNQRIESNQFTEVREEQSPKFKDNNEQNNVQINNMNKKDQNSADGRLPKTVRPFRFDVNNMQKMNSRRAPQSQNSLNYFQEQKKSIEQQFSNQTLRDLSKNSNRKEKVPSNRSSGFSNSVQSSEQKNSSGNLSQGKNSLQAGYSNSSSNSEQYKFIQGQVQYDAQQIILEESKSQFEVSADDTKTRKKFKMNQNFSSGLLSRVSQLSSSLNSQGVSNIYDDIDKQNVQN